MIRRERFGRRMVYDCTNCAFTLMFHTWEKVANLRCPACGHPMTRQKDVVIGPVLRDAPAAN